ncbi:MAG: hypothetical protein Q8P20_05255 [bacterium]|nr:hypothetical protein [bacterium]
MHKLSVKHTLDIFSHLVLKMPPLVPKGIQTDVKQAYEQMKSNFGLELEETEKTIIVFGKKLWPYRRAFEEFFSVYKSEVGEKFLVGKLTPKLKRRYSEFLEYGGTFRDLHSGNPALFFSSDERVEACEALIQVNTDVSKYTAQAVLATTRTSYEKRVVEFQTILDDIEKRLASLLVMAEAEQEHPELAEEIRQQVLSFEYGLCLLGPPHHYDAICQSEEHFKGRKIEQVYRV